MVIENLILLVLVIVLVNIVYSLIDILVYHQRMRKELESSHELKSISKECAACSERNFGVLIEDVKNFEIYETSDFFTRECGIN